MSLKYRDSQGIETPVAGLNGTSGELVPSVSLYQKGSQAFSCAANSWTTVDVTLNTPMPDNDYQVILDSGATAYVHVQNVMRKSTTGFVAIVYNRDSLSSEEGVLNWQAFKLMTDEVHEADSAHIAQNTANFAPAFSDVTSYAVGDYVTYNNILYRCTTAHTAGVWVAGHFTQVTVGGNLSSLDTLKTDFASFGKIDTASGYLTDDQLKAINYNVCKTVGYAGSEEIPDSTTILVGFMNFTQGTDQQYQLLFQFNTGKVWTRARYGTWTSWQKLVAENTLNTYAKPHIYNLGGAAYSTLQAFFDELVTRLKADASGNDYGICFMGTWTGKSFFEGSFYTVDGRSSYIKVTFQNPQDSKSLYTGYTGYSDVQVTYTGVA